MRRSLTTLMVMLGLATGLSACAPAYDGFDCAVVNDTPSGGLCSDRTIEVARGEAMVVRVSPQSDTREDYDDPEVELRPSDPQLMDVRPGFGGEHTLIGLTEGDLHTEIWIDGELVDEVTTRIVASDPSGPSD